MEDAIHYSHWSLWIPRYAIWPCQRPLRLPGIHEQGVLGVPPLLRHWIHRWCTHLLPEPGRPSPPLYAGPSEDPPISSVRVPSCHCAVPRLYHWSRKDSDVPGEGDSHHGVAHSPVSQGASEISGICSFLSTLHQRFQLTYIDVYALRKTQVPVLEHQCPWSLQETQDCLQHSSQSFTIQTPMSHLWWKWTPPPSELCCPSNSVSLHRSSLAHITLRNWPRQSRIMTSEIMSFSPSSWLWKSGGTGWRELTTHSLSSQTIKTSNTSVKPVGLCFSTGSISPSFIAQETTIAKLTPYHAFIPSIHHQIPSRFSLQPSL